jgi:hypothetical protein
LPAPDPRPEPPERPGDNECCQSGCEPCIFDMYADDMNEYRVALAAWEARQKLRDQAG